MITDKKMITWYDIEKFSREYENDLEAEKIRKKIQEKGMADGVKKIIRPSADDFEFCIKLPTYGRTNQGRTGRCWIFAALNCFRMKVCQQYGLEEFYFSQNYLAFYDLLEKASFFIECIRSTIDESPDSRIVSELLKKPVQDAGQWDMLVSLVEKYGLIPYEAMPDTRISMDTRELIEIISEFLRYEACCLRKTMKEGCSRELFDIRKKKILGKVYRILCITLGKPPELIHPDYLKGIVQIGNGIRPITFARDILHLTKKCREYVSVINVPMKDRPYNRVYTIEYLGNIVGGRKIRYLNLSMNRMTQLIISQLQMGEAVWIGADTTHDVDKENGILRLKTYDVEELTKQSFSMSKEENLLYGNSRLTHAVVIKGVNLKNGQPERWYAENSYGKDAGHQGHVMMTSDWFNYYTYEAVILKQLLTEEEKNEYASEAEVLPLWDPIGALAR